MQYLIRIVLTGVVLFFLGCATMKQSLGTGVAVGAGSGLLLGPVINSNGGSRTKVSGALIGAAVGGIAAYFLHSNLQERDARIRKETLFNLDKFSVSRPQTSMQSEYGVAAPNIETECFETEIKGNKLIQAHCESKIVGRPEWIKSYEKRGLRHE